MKALSDPFLKALHEAAIVAVILQFIPIIGQIATAVMFVFLYIIFWVVIPVAVIERPGPVASLKRSVALTEGHRWKILGIFLLVIAISIARMMSRAHAGAGTGRPSDRAVVDIVWLLRDASQAGCCRLMAVSPRTASI